LLYYNGISQHCLGCPQLPCFSKYDLAGLKMKNYF